MAIRLNILTQFDNRGLKAAQRELSQISTSIGRALDATVIAGFAGAAAGLTSAVKSASNYMAEFEGVNQVFGEAAKSVQDFAKKASESAGLSSTEALNASKTFGLFAKSSGLSDTAAAKFSTTLTQLAGDLGSFNDVPTADALAAIQSGLQGQAEPLRKFGVFLTDDALKAEAMAMKIYDGTGALTAQQKMLASYNLILNQTKIQQGDFVKYGDTFGNKIKTITKEFANLQTEIGMQLIPVIEQLLPEIQALIPVIGAQLKAAVEAVDWKAFFTAIVDGFTFLVTYGKDIAAIITIMWGLSKAIKAVEIATKLAAVTTALFTGTLTATPWGALALGIGAVAVAGYNIAEAMHKAYLETEGVREATQLLANSTPSGGFKVGAGRAAQGGAWANRNSQATKDLAKQMKVIEDATKKASDRFKENKAAVGDNSDEAAKYAEEMKKLFAEILKTTSAEEKNKDALKASKKAQKEHSAARKEYWQELVKTREKLKEEAEALAEAQQAMRDATAGIKTLMDTSVDMGEFESRVVDTFTNIKDVISSSLADGKITRSAAYNLSALADSTQASIQAIAKQRDALIAKRSLVEALIGDVKGSLMGAGNITGLLETQSKTVTKTVTQIINGLQVAVSTTTEEITSGGLLKNFKSVLDKTKAFAGQLKELRKLGLDQNLFKQIVDAGAEAGGAVAAEIIAGGADAVSEINGVYKDLADVSGQIAEQTAVVMYNDGKDVAGGLVAGLLAQEQALKDAATTLANAFMNTFNSMISGLTLPSQAGKGISGLNANGFAYSSNPLLGGTMESQFGSGTPWAIAAAKNANPSTPINIVVNAGVGTNGKVVGQAILEQINTYKAANGGSF